MAKERKKKKSVPGLGESKGGSHLSKKPGGLVSEQKGGVWDQTGDHKGLQERVKGKELWKGTLKSGETGPWEKVGGNSSEDNGGEKRLGTQVNERKKRAQVWVGKVHFSKKKEGVKIKDPDFQKGFQKDDQASRTEQTNDAAHSGEGQWQRVYKTRRCQMLDV